MRVTVTKSDHKKVNLGVGYGTEEKARVQVDWRHVNIFVRQEPIYDREELSDKVGEADEVFIVQALSGG